MSTSEEESESTSELPDFEDPEFEAEEWAENFETAEEIGEILDTLLDRPTTTTVENGSQHITLVFIGQELEALRALAQRLRELD